jgi:hypothetical protein
MPHRVRLRTVRTNASGQEVPVRRTQRIHLPGYHLWLTHSGTIWDLDRADGNLTDGFAAKRGCAGASGPTPGILRDDRDRLARLHALSVQWYLVPRQSLTVALRCCGLLPSFQSIIDVRTPTSTTSRTYPQLGQVISTVIAGGQQQAINTPVTQVAYDHVQQMTTWTTDWPNLAF